LTRVGTSTPKIMRPLMVIGASAANRLPVAGLLAFAMTGFIPIMTERVPAGLLWQITGGPGVSDALGGLLLVCLGAGSFSWAMLALLLLALTAA